MRTSNSVLNCRKKQFVVQENSSKVSVNKETFRSFTVYKQQLIMIKLFNTQAYLGSQFTSSSYQRFLYGFRNQIAVIHLDSTLRCLRRACRFLIRSVLVSANREDSMRKRCELFFVNENPEYNALIRHTAKRLSQNYSNDKWVGGLLTNWEHIQVVYEDFKTVLGNLMIVKTEPCFRGVESNVVPGSSSDVARSLEVFGGARSFHPGVSHLGHNPSVNLPRGKSNNDLFLLKTLPRFKKWEHNFEGLVSKERPDCLIALNGNQNSIAIKEASCLGIPIIALIDSNISKDLQKAIGYPIPGNTESLELVYVICNSLVKSVESVSIKVDVVDH